MGMMVANEKTFKMAVSMSVSYTHLDVYKRQTYMLTDDIGYIKLGRNFGFNTFSEFITAISKLKSRGATGLIIDLRGNVGGALEVVVAMVNEFLQKGDLIVYTAVSYTHLKKN